MARVLLQVRRRLLCAAEGAPEAAAGWAPSELGGEPEGKPDNPQRMIVCVHEVFPVLLYVQVFPVLRLLYMY